MCCRHSHPTPNVILEHAFVRQPLINVRGAAYCHPRENTSLSLTHDNMFHILIITIVTALACWRACLRLLLMVDNSEVAGVCAACHPVPYAHGLFPANPRGPPPAAPNSHLLFHFSSCILPNN